jgi:hypothetical protein
MVSIAWGPLITHAGNQVEGNSDFGGYTVFLVDAVGRVVHRVTDLNKAKQVTGCCPDRLYVASYRGMLPAGAKKLMVVPWFKDSSAMSLAPGESWAMSQGLPSGQKRYNQIKAEFDAMDGNNNSEITMTEITNWRAQQYQLQNPPITYTTEQQQQDIAQFQPMLGDNNMLTMEEFWIIRSNEERRQFEDGMLVMPMAFESAEIVDVQVGSSEEIRGNFSLTMASQADAQAATEDPNFKLAMSSSIATTVAVPEKLVYINSMNVEQGSRRLGLGAARRLQAGTYKVVVDYVIIIPPTYTGVAPTASTIAAIDTNVFVAAINTELQEKGVVLNGNPIQITGMDPIVAPTSSTVTGTPEAGTGGARRQAGMFAAIVAVAMAALMLVETC